MCTSCMLIQNLLILSTILKISGKQSKVLVLVCAHLFISGKISGGEMHETRIKTDTSFSSEERDAGHFQLMTVTVKRGYPEGF